MFCLQFNPNRVLIAGLAIGLASAGLPIVDPIQWNVVHQVGGAPPGLEPIDPLMTPDPNAVPLITDAERNSALDIAAADPYLQDVLQGTTFAVEWAGVWHSGPAKLGVAIFYSLSEPQDIEGNWLHASYDSTGVPQCFQNSVYEVETAVSSLMVLVSLDCAVVLDIDRGPPPWPH